MSLLMLYLELLSNGGTDYDKMTTEERNEGLKVRINTPKFDDND